jgi:VIT1/CCC1 family predicted Fe2+/Mn2+ transporter
MAATPKPHGQHEAHRSSRAKWLRAAVLGADDAIVSTSSLMIGVAASQASRHAILLSGVAGLVAGAMSMAAGEYVSVSSQRDSELADIDVEKEELATEPKAELEELAKIYMKRGLEPDLARRVAKALSRHDVLATHLRDELGIEPDELSAPLEAAFTSAVSFATFALVPIGGLLVAPEPLRVPIIALVSLVSLAALGALGGYLGGAPTLRAAIRVTIGGALAMAATAGIGRLFGVATG